MWNSPNMLTICCVRSRISSRSRPTLQNLIVLKQDAYDKLGEPARWVLYVADFDKSPNPAMDKARTEQWMKMYSILDRSTFEESFVQADQGITGRFPSRELSDRRSTDWIRGQCFKVVGRHFHYISRRFPDYPFRVYHALHSHGIYGKLRRCFRA
jgi:hypothetical protein